MILIHCVGEPQGLIGSHNFIEADSSNTRDDLYVTGNNYALDMDKFMSWYNMSVDGTFDMDLMAKRAKLRFEEAIQTNPNFYYGPVTGLIARNAGYIFPGRLFRNHSRENPEGILSKQRQGAEYNGQEGMLILTQLRVIFETSTVSTARMVTLPTGKDGKEFLRTGTRRLWTTVSYNSIWILLSGWQSTLNLEGRIYTQY